MCKATQCHGRLLGNRKTRTNSNTSCEATDSSSEIYVARPQVYSPGDVVAVPRNGQSLDINETGSLSTFGGCGEVENSDIPGQKATMGQWEGWLWVCCSCGEGPHLVATTPACIACGIPRCADCTLYAGGPKELPTRIVLSMNALSGGQNSSRELAQAYPRHSSNRWGR